MTFVFGFLPVILFLLSLFLLDSFKLVSPKLLILCLFWGIVAAGLSYYLNSWAGNYEEMNSIIISKYVAPIFEELTKGVLLLILVARKRVGFMIDAAIYGFAIGTGFALAENIWYLIQLGESFNLLLAIVRGFGTAMMHGGTVAIFAIIIIEGVHRSQSILIGGIPGIVIAIILHSAFNHFIFNPFLQTLLIITLLPLALYLVFNYTTRHLQNWLEVEFSNEIEMLSMINKGKLSQTKSGQYLAKLKEHFPGESLIDMHCFFRLYLELSIKAKRNMLLKENGFPIIIEPDIKDKLIEIKLLRKQIGKAGEMALLPLVRMSHRELWELNQLQ